MGSRDLRRVAALAYEGLGTFEFGIVVEVFGLPRTGMGVAWYDFEVCSLERGPVHAAGGILVQARRGLSALREPGTIVIPGWRYQNETPPRALIDALRAAHADGARLVSICSGVFLLAATGLLDGKCVTPHWRRVGKFRARFPNVRVDPGVLYVDEGNILTSAASAAGIDLCLHIVRRDYGAKVAHELARRLVMATHRHGGQAQFIEDPLGRPGANGLAAVMEWAQANLAQALAVEDLARRAAMSPRTFARQFRRQTGTTPHQGLTHQRVMEAQRRLETTDASVDRIAEVVGLQTAATLRQHFRSVVGTSPAAYRRARVREA
jgi:AraC family transcriptional activator FtrA